MQAPFVRYPQDLGCWQNLTHGSAAGDCHTKAPDTTAEAHVLGEKGGPFVIKLTDQRTREEQCATFCAFLSGTPQKGGAGHEGARYPVYTKRERKNRECASTSKGGES